jgi:hypothetical protein
VTADAPYERTTKAPATNHPPCDQQCWEKVGVYTWVFTKGQKQACWWDEESKSWTRCDRSTR